MPTNGHTAVPFSAFDYLRRLVLKFTDAYSRIHSKSLYTGGFPLSTSSGDFFLPGFAPLRYGQWKKWPRPRHGCAESKGFEQWAKGQVSEVRRRVSPRKLVFVKGVRPSGEGSVLVRRRVSPRKLVFVKGVRPNFCRFLSLLVPPHTPSGVISSAFCLPFLIRVILVNLRSF